MLVGYPRLPPFQIGGADLGRCKTASAPVPMSVIKGLLTHD